MELMFISLGGAILGLAARYSLPRRDSHGAVLVPALGAAIAAVVWVALTWAGLKWDAGLIWVISLVVTGAAVTLIDLQLGKRRERADALALDGMLKGTIPVSNAVSY